MFKLGATYSLALMKIRPSRPSSARTRRVRWTILRPCRRGGKFRSRTCAVLPPAHRIVSPMSVPLAPSVVCIGVCMSVLVFIRCVLSLWVYDSCTKRDWCVQSLNLCAFLKVREVLQAYSSVFGYSACLKHQYSIPIILVKGLSKMADFLSFLTIPMIILKNINSHLLQIFINIINRKTDNIKVTTFNPFDKNRT